MTQYFQSSVSVTPYTTETGIPTRWINRYKCLRGKSHEIIYLSSFSMNMFRLMGISYHRRVLAIRLGVDVFVGYVIRHPVDTGSLCYIVEFSIVIVVDWENVCF